MCLCTCENGKRVEFDYLNFRTYTKRNNKLFFPRIGNADERSMRSRRAKSFLTTNRTRNLFWREKNWIYRKHSSPFWNCRTRNLKKISVQRSWPPRIGCVLWLLNFIVDIRARPNSKGFVHRRHSQFSVSDKFSKWRNRWYPFRLIFFFQIE